MGPTTGESENVKIAYLRSEIKTNKQTRRKGKMGSWMLILLTLFSTAFGALYGPTSDGMSLSLRLFLTKGGCLVKLDGVPLGIPISIGQNISIVVTIQCSQTRNNQQTSWRFWFDSPWGSSGSPQSANGSLSISGSGSQNLVLSIWPLPRSFWNSYSHTMNVFASFQTAAITLPLVCSHLFFLYHLTRDSSRIISSLDGQGCLYL